MNKLNKDSIELAKLTLTNSINWWKNVHPCECEEDEQELKENEDLLFLLEFKTENSTKHHSIEDISSYLKNDKLKLINFCHDMIRMSDHVNESDNKKYNTREIIQFVAEKFNIGLDELDEF